MSSVDNLLKLPYLFRCLPYNVTVMIVATRDLSGANLYTKFFIITCIVYTSTVLIAFALQFPYYPRTNITVFVGNFILSFKDFSMDCGICYAYRLDGAIPDQVCDDSRCGQPFHQACLYEVRRSEMSSKAVVQPFQNLAAEERNRKCLVSTPGL